LSARMNSSIGVVSRLVRGCRRDVEADVVGRPGAGVRALEEYEPWRRKHLVVDSARMSAESAARLIESKIVAVSTVAS
jgi:hypothetical protein